LDFYRWQTEREDYSSPERAFVTLCGGPEKALAWLERNGASLHAKLSARLQPPDMATSTEEISTDGQKEP
jgi:hypothetical protein